MHQLWIQLWNLMKQRSVAIYKPVIISTILTFKFMWLVHSRFCKIAGYKSQIFTDLRGNANKILELGIGTGPNLKYYASNGVNVIGVDPNQKMEKYAKAAAVSTGLPSEKFKFVRAVCIISRILNFLVFIDILHIECWWICFFEAVIDSCHFKTMLAVEEIHCL